MMNIDQSIHTILTREKVVADLFYLKFLDRYPKVRPFFLNVDMRQQNVLLTMGLFIAQQYHRFQYPTMRQYLQLLGHRHHLRRIPADLYADWRECLVATLREFHGREWTTGLQGEWTAAIDGAIEIMQQGYQDPLRFN